MKKSTGNNINVTNRRKKILRFIINFLASSMIEFTNENS